ncbi:MAG: class I SAM-dependent methyltransferase, partial [Methylococcales bacterium]
MTKRRSHKSVKNTKRLICHSTPGMLNPPYPSDSFDVIVSFETIEHLPNPEKYLSAVSKMLKADGAFIVSTPVRTKGRLTDKPANPFHV